MSVESKQVSHLDIKSETERFSKSQELQNFNPDKQIEKPESKITKTPLTEANRIELQKETGWSDKIIDNITYKEEAEIYKNANLKETEVNGRPCLVKSEINLSPKDDFGKINSERMEKGLPPLDKNGKFTELHHMGQKNDAPLVELTQEEHRGHPNYGLLHDKSRQPEINRHEFIKVRNDHWLSRASEIQEEEINE